MTKFVARKPGKEVISMRISVDTLQISRNELINQMLLLALANMEEQIKE